MYTSMPAAHGYLRGKIAAMTAEAEASASSASFPMSPSSSPPSSSSRNTDFLQKTRRHIKKWLQRKAATQRIAPASHQHSALHEDLPKDLHEN